MWELIRANKRKSAFLITVMFGFMLFLGWFIGMYIDPVYGGYFGILAAFVIWLVQFLIAAASGGKVFLAGSRAVEVTKENYPQLYNVVEEMKIASGLPAMPKVYVIPENHMNAFATGTKPENACVTVTSGLMSRLNRDELQGVVAHEMSHILNRDVLYMTYCGIMLGTIVFLSEGLLWTFRFGMLGGGGRYSSRSKSSGGGGGGAQVAMLLLALVLAILAPILAQLMYFSISRKREYLADASAARLTRYPEGLANALEKISRGKVVPEKTSKVKAPMYIYNPEEGNAMKFSSLSSTHPPTEERIRILRNMSHGASYKDYQKSYSQTHEGKKSNLIPEGELEKEQSVSKRSPAERLNEMSGKEKAREIGDMIMTANSFRFLTCNCGLKLKIPPDYKHEKVKCPKCGTLHNVAAASAAAAAV
ncbi:M48 family metallopeptidase [Sedimentisphaera salicampi]|uniref:Protease HtpX homolog n=1 Tax=Sedimentisphaera salicampi TaxID=1941349 RepID=A0A1W6LPM5_9BACT|nr:M48 family metallopeptidase [Sedimentisphaera salicampi]ARN57724.1 Protease HtpX-like protein [Sedimentisphaera salicampi]OXU14282.1 putative protease HtpX [Sedimentisphaera salicampi]